jgi:hypothetical protein
MVIPPGMASFWTWSPPKEWLFLRESQASGRGIHQRNDYSSGNGQFLDVESTKGMVIPPGITGFWKRNPPKEWLFLRGWQASVSGIHQRNGYSSENRRLPEEESTKGMVIPPGMAGFCKWNPPKEWLFLRESQAS